MILCTSLLRFISRVQSNSVNVSKWCLMVPIRGKWCIPIALLECAICTCFYIGNMVVVFKWLSVVHMVVCEVAIVLQSKFIKLFDVATSPKLSLATDHLCLSHSLDFDCFQWSRCRKCFWLYLLLLLTLHPCSFPSHMQDMTLMRSYYRQSSLAIICVDGCCLYFIIHNSVSLRTWL